MKLFPVLVVALIATLARATPPVLDAGTCTYLVGAPAGAVAATDAEPFDGSSVAPVCLATYQVGARAFEPNGVQLHAVPTPLVGGQGCRIAAWVGHEFVVGGSGPGRRASIDLVGGVDGQIGQFLQLGGQGVLWVAMQLEERDVLSGDWLRAAEVVLFDEGALAAQQQLYRDRFAQRLEAIVTPGQDYRVTLVAELRTTSNTFLLDFGPPGAGRGVWYDSIKVCIDAPDAPTAPLVARLDALESADLEARLYERQCMPRVWMPAAQGGLLESARSLVRARIDQAAATGDAGVNRRVAEARLANADTNIASAQYQRACRELSESLRALTTH